MSPRVTVLMPVFNGARYLREAIDSILSQTLREFELLIINDGSTDGSRDMLEAYRDPRIRIIDNGRNLGLTVSLNIGLRAAHGELIARQDADDRSYPSRLERQLQWLDAHPAVVLLGSEIRYINEGGRRVPATMWPRCATAAGIRWQLMFESPFAHSSVMFRRSIILGEMGGYDEGFRAGQDFELWSRASRTRAMSNLLEPLVDLRSHRESISAHRTIADVERVRDVLRSNLTLTAGAGDYESWLDFWVTVNNPGTYGRIHNLGGFLGDLAAIRGRFAARNADATNEGEIDRQTAGALARASCNIARQDRRAALSAYGAAIRRDRKLALRVLPRFAANFVLGRIGAARSGNAGTSRG